MTYPPVIQFETRAADVEAQARLLAEREAARPAEREGLRLSGWPRGRLRTPQTQVMRLTARGCGP